MTPSVNPNPNNDWKVETSPIYGRHLVSKRNFKAGEVILSEFPFSFVPFQQVRFFVK